MTARPRNVLILWTDQQRPDTIGAYRRSGDLYACQTPAVDRLAAGSVVFEHAYCTQPSCSPSRASVLTGLYPHAHGVVSHGSVTNFVPPVVRPPTFAEVACDTGYTCAYVGASASPPKGLDDWCLNTGLYVSAAVPQDPNGPRITAYQHFLRSRGYTPPNGKATFGRDDFGRLPEAVCRPAFQAGEAIRFLETQRDHPFLLSVNFTEPHPPYHGPFDGLYDRAQVPLPRSYYEPMEETVPLRYRRRRAALIRDGHLDRLGANDEAAWKDLKARYWGNCTLVDKYAGQIVTKLDELGLAEDTIVVYLSDHGDMMGEHRLIAKQAQYEAAIHTPLIIRVPGLVPRRVVTPVSQVDLMPTLLRLLDLPVPDHVQGTDLCPLLEAGAIDPKDAEVIIEWNGGSPHPPEDARPDLLNEPEEVKRRLRGADVRTIRRGRWKLNVHASGECELYDLQSDPEELHNAAYDRGKEGIVQELFQRLVRWQRATDDPVKLPDPADAPI